MSNKEFNDKTVKQLSKSIDLELDTNDTLKQALTHRSYKNENKEALHNERLEFIGDAVLELITTEFLFKKYPTHPEGDLTSFRAALVRTESLAEEARKLKIGEFLFMSGGEESTGGRTREYILANAVEALIGAIYLLKGYSIAKQWVEKNICYKIEEIVEQRLDIDAKSRLQEIVQEKIKITPSYKLIKAEGPDHNKVFTMAVLLNDKELAIGEGKSKQEAEQKAAQEALELWSKQEKELIQTL